MMSTNNEPAAMDQVIGHYQDTPLPALIFFISDGGINQSRAIKQRLIDTSTQPLFWQFVGIGGRQYGILEALDTVTGRMIDNSGFFAIDDLTCLSEQDLYDRLLHDFSIWWAEAKAQGGIL
jgi:hypothetical protein